MRIFNQIINSANMKIALKDIAVLFQQMSQELLNIESVSIVVFIAVDADSICTLKIFSKMFKCENIQYKVYPVTTYTELESRIEESRAYDRVKMFMFINCGGLIDLTLFWIVQSKQAQIFLFDVHKPIHHKNLQSTKIKIVDDGKSQFEHCPTSEELDKYDELNEYDLDSGDDDLDQSDMDERVEGSPKRGKKREFRGKLRKHKNLIEEKISNYYGQNFFGNPSSFAAYRLMRDTQKAQNEYLWYAIVGMTSMYLQQKISRDTFVELTEFYKSEVTRFNPVSTKKEKGQISSKKGFQFTLLDHWSLYDSMMNSNYMMIKLHLWDQKGFSKLNEFIHHLEISLLDAKQLFKFMPKEAQMKLENNIIPTAERFKILDVVFDSFQKQIDYVDSAMASDYYYILTSILEAPPKRYVPVDDLSSHRVSCFWQAYEMLDGNMKQLAPKIEDYKKTVKVLMTETKNIIERDHLITMNNISIANIRNDTDDKKIFEHPSTLIRLAYILMGVVREKERFKTSKFKPFIANWIDLEKEVCMTVGVMTNNRNSIGTRFNDVAERLKIQVNHDNFMANIIMMKKENLGEFIREVSNC